MKRSLWIGLAAGLLIGTIAPRGGAQGLDYRPAPGEGADYGNCVYYGPEFLALVDETDRHHVEGIEQRFQQWVAQLRPGTRQLVLSNLLIGIHPVLAFVPTEGLVRLPGDPAPVPAGEDRDVRVTVQEANSGSLIFGVGVNSDAGVTGCIVVSGGELPPVPPPPPGISCPHLLRRLTPPAGTAPPVEPPDVMTNLERLLRADQFLKRGEQLSRDGRFTEAVGCFEEVHRLVPGTNLEARAGAATERVLVRVYGTATEGGLVDEPSEPEEVLSKEPLPPRLPCPSCGAKACARGVAATPAYRTQLKPRTVVYPVADLLGKGTETKHDDLEELLDVIVTTVEPRSWTENGGEGTVEYYYRARAVVVNQTPEVHEQIAELLASLRKAKEQSENAPARPGPSPASDRAAKADAEEGCCEECCPGADCCEKPDAPRPAGKACGAGCRKCEKPCDRCCTEGCCDGCHPATVLTLPAPACGTGNCAKLRVVTEGCTEELGGDPTPEASRPDRTASAGGVRCTAGGLCAEADAAPGGVRFRWQVPVGPLTVLVEYGQGSLTLGLGLCAPEEAAAEESESRP
jgi:hypothetical protein